MIFGKDNYTKHAQIHANIAMLGRVESGPADPAGDARQLLSSTPR